MFEEIKKFKDLIVTWLALFIGVGIFFFFFGTAPATFFGHLIHIPLPTDVSFAAQFFRMMEDTILPPGVTLVALGPLSALNTQTIVAFMLSFLVTFPYLLYRLVRYISPALHSNERKAFLTVLVPAVILFFSGALFSYKFVIPPTFKALYSYTAATGVVSIFSMEAFVSTVVTFMVVSGFLFLLPIFMVLLSFLGICPPPFWWKNWRYAQFSFLAFSAIITLDGSGVSMVLLSLPLTGLYAVGAMVAQVTHKERVTEKT